MKPLLLIGLMAILLSGCITIDYNQKVDRDGGAVITQKMNFSGLLALGNGSSASMSDLSGVCENVTEGQSGIDCAYADGVVTLNKSVGADEGVYLFNRSSEFPYVIYTLEVRKAPQLVESEVSAQGGAGAGMPADTDFKDPSSKLAATTLRTAGAKMTYTVEMPGELMSAENGEIILEPAGNSPATTLSSS